MVCQFGRSEAGREMCIRDRLYDVVRSVPYNIQPDRGEADSPDYVLALQAVSYTHLDVYKRQVLSLT